jgi:Zn-dependent protease
METLFFFVVLIASAIIHEYMHGWMALQLGDRTAEYAGRLTLDPRRHIDPMGTILMPLILFFVTGGRFLFAYAKPVPYNPYNLRDGKWGPVKVALAGPAANFFLAAVFGVLIRLIFSFDLVQFTNLLPFLSIIVYTNVLLGVFNLVPIPPLDGSKLLYALLPEQAQKLRQMLNQYGMFLLFGFIFFGFKLLYPIMNGVYYVFTGMLMF